MFYDGTGITYFNNQGNLYKANLLNNNGQLQLTGKQQLDVPVKSGITKILWPSRGDDYIAQFTNSSGKTTWSYFNHNTGTYTDLPSQVESVDWMPGGQKIMYVWLDNNVATLSLGNPDTTGHQTLAKMWETDDEIYVSPDGAQVLYYETQNSSGNNFINSVTADGKLWKGLIKNGQNYGVLWSPDGQKFLFGKKDPSTGQYQLWFYNLTSGEIKNLGLFTTADKAVWDKDSNTIYASVPSSAAASNASLTVDSFYRLNTSTLDKKQYPSSGAAMDGKDLFLNPTGDKLFFRNAQDGGLYYLDLTQ
jgi:protease II